MAGCHRRVLAVLALVLGLTASVAAANSTRTHAHAGAAVPLGGVNVAGLIFSSPAGQDERPVAMARKLGAKLVRAEIPWSALEPLGANRIDPQALAFTDRLVGSAAAAGIRVILTVDSTPCWDSSAPASLLSRCHPGRKSAANSWPPRAPAAYAAVVAFLAQRYGTRLAAIEIWNEPDQANQDYFAGPDKPRRYAAILRAAYPAIKQANAGVTVLAGSLVGSNGVFLRALYAAGIKGYYDALAVHFYNLTLGSLRAIHETQLASGDAAPLWLDEFGWSSCWPHARIQQEQACVTPQMQAANVANIFRSLARTPWIGAEVLFDLQGSRAEDFGVLSGTGARKPAFTALARVLASPLASPRRVTLSLRARHGQVRASGSGPVGDYMGLEAFQGSTLRYRAIFTLDRFNRYALKLPRVLGTHGLRVRVFQYWAGVGRDAQRTI